MYPDDLHHMYLSQFPTSLLVVCGLVVSLFASVYPHGRGFVVAFWMVVGWAVVAVK